MSNAWYYADANGRQIGPISSDELRAAVRRGAAGATTLAWRDGLSEWTPISKLAEELQLELGTSANPYRAPDTAAGLRVRAGAGEIVYAGFWRRFAARILDHFVVFVPVYLLVFIVAGGVGAFTKVQTGESSGSGLLVAVYLVPMIANFFYFSAMHSSSWQATIGKRALGIKVTDEDGGQLTFGRAAVRWFSSALSYLTIYVGFIMAGFTERKRALHDMLASTLVVDKWAFTDTPEKQNQGMSGCLIVFIVLFVGGLFIVPILAAISISQYQDYVIRTQVYEGSVLADGVKTAYGEYVANHPDSVPGSNSQVGLADATQIQGSYVRSVDIGAVPGSIVVEYSSLPPQKANSAISGKHLVFDARAGAGTIEWTCHSDELKQKWCPSTCSCHG